MADRMVRIFVTAETAAAIARLEAVGATADEIAAGSTAAMDETAASTDAAGNSFSLAGLKSMAMANPWITAGLAVGAVAVGVGVFAVNMADKFDKATDSLAADAGISTKSAQKISDSFLDAGNSTIYDATAITSAYAGVAAQLGSVEGHALDAAQAQQIMNAAQNLATATGGDLAGTTSSLATVMQIYGQKSTAAAGDSNILFNAARLVGGGVDTVTASVQKLVAGLGVAAPPLKDVGGLLEDLATHGETGRKAISAVTSGFATLIKTSLGVTVAQRNMATDMDGLTGPALALAQQLEAGTISSYNYGKAVEQLGGQQGVLATAFGSAYSAYATAQVKITDLGITVDNAKGKFVGIGSVISQLHAIYVAHGADAAQAAATDALGAGAANKLMKTIEAGPATYNADVAAVVKSNAAHEAAQKRLQNLGAMFDEVKTKVEDTAIKFGEVLVPALSVVGGAIVKVVDMLAHDLQPVFATISAGVATLSAWIADHWNTIKNVTSSVWNAIHEILSIAWKVDSTEATIAWDIISTIIGTAITVIIAVIEKIVQIISFLVGVWQTVTSDITGFISGAVKLFNGLPGPIKTAVEVITNILIAPFTLALAPIKAVVEQIASWIGDIVGSANTATGELTNVKNNSVLSQVGTGKGVGVLGQPLGSGGIVNSPGIFPLAESGPEMVIPLTGSRPSVSPLPSGLGGGGIVNIYVTSNDGQAVVNALKQYQQSHGSIPIRVSGH
jgi:hypothetical protein